jgi:hypothetical protein
MTVPLEAEETLGVDVVAAVEVVIADAGGAEPPEEATGAESPVPVMPARSRASRCAWKKWSCAVCAAL